MQEMVTFHFGRGLMFNMSEIAFNSRMVGETVSKYRLTPSL